MRGFTPSLLDIDATLPSRIAGTRGANWGSLVSSVRFPLDCSCAKSTLLSTSSLESPGVTALALASCGRWGGFPTAAGTPLSTGTSLAATVGGSPQAISDPLATNVATKVLDDRPPT